MRPSAHHPVGLRQRPQAAADPQPELSAAAIHDASAGGLSIGYEFDAAGNLVATRKGDEPATAVPERNTMMTLGLLAEVFPDMFGGIRDKGSLPLLDCPEAG